MGKSNLQVAVRNAMRLRIFNANVISPQRFQLPNTKFEKPSSGAWMRESINEGSEEAMTNAAGREFAVVNYEIFCRSAFGTNETDEIVDALRALFPVIGNASTVYNSGGQYAFVKSIDKPAGGIDGGDSIWYRRLVAITVAMYNP